jgi:aspartyl-tRNA(Asn)/glutamyl-tRNA(Gln) amidotransferase subunit B
MEKGSMRLEANISLQELSIINDQFSNNDQISNVQLPNYKVEVKNINSFRYLERAIEYEIGRQRKLLEKGETPVQETRGFDEKRGVTFSQRSKEEAADYRYFPEPDIPPLEFSGEMIREIEKEIPELPVGAWRRLVKMGVREDFAEVLVSSKESLAGFDGLVKKLSKEFEVGEVAKQVVNQKWDLGKLSTGEVVKKLKKAQKKFSMSGGQIEGLAKQVIKENPGPVTEYKKGKVGVLGFLVGQVVKKSRGEADPREVKGVLEEGLPG